MVEHLSALDKYASLVRYKYLYLECARAALDTHENFPEMSLTMIGDHICVPIINGTGLCLSPWLIYYYGAWKIVAIASTTSPAPQLEGLRPLGWCRDRDAILPRHICELLGVCCESENT